MNSLIITLIKNICNDESRFKRINVQKIASLKDLLNKPISQIRFEIQSLKEIYRILKPGGRFICLEFSHVHNSLLKKIYDIWSFKYMPMIGQKVTGDKEAYNYLVESIRQFPSQNELSLMFSEAGFARVKYRNLSNGIVTLHSGWKL